MKRTITLILNMARDGKAAITLVDTGAEVHELHEGQRLTITATTRAPTLKVTTQ